MGDLGIDRPDLSNRLAIAALAIIKSEFIAPGEKYQYSNTGYLLLASVAEKISGENFKKLVKEKILDPLDLKNTFLNGSADGMGGMTSTVHDLMKWNNAVFGGKLISLASLDTALSPYPVKQGSSIYGFA